MADALVKRPASHRGSKMSLRLSQSALGDIQTSTRLPARRDVSIPTRLLQSRQKGLNVVYKSQQEQPYRPEDIFEPLASAVRKLY
jgi:hypothetical protein